MLLTFLKETTHPLFPFYTTTTTTTTGDKKLMFHPWYHHRDIGQKWMHDPLWETPFERPGIVPRLYNRQYQLHLYPNNIGAVADVDASITKEKPPSGDYAGSGMHTNKFCFFFIFSVVLSHTHMATSLLSSLSWSLFNYSCTEGAGGSETIKPGADNQPKNAGQRGSAPKATTDYQPPSLQHMPWDGIENDDKNNSPSPGPIKK